MGGKSFSAAAATEREERKSSINNINSNIIEATFFLFQRFNKNFPREEQKEKFFGLAVCVGVCMCDEASTVCCEASGSELRRRRKLEKLI